MKCNSEEVEEEEKKCVGISKVVIKRKTKEFFYNDQTKALYKFRSMARINEKKYFF